MQSQVLNPSVDATPVDLRSDTVTKPTEAMYKRMLSAKVGDDGLDGDPTVMELEAVAAAALGKEAGLFVPSCTMSNLLAVLAQSQRQQQLVLESDAHMNTTERGAATFTGLFYLGVAGIAGAMDLNAMEDALQSGGTKLKTALVCMETSHNNAGGAVLPIEHMSEVYRMSASRGIPVHLDGARMFNAAVALGVPPAKIACHADTVSLCLSKGLSAPVGAVLVGTAATIKRARILRKMIGGTQRQLGIMAAAGIEAVQVMGDRLSEDHAKAKKLSLALNTLHPKLSASIPQTNIVQVDLSSTGRDGARWVDDLEKEGLLVRPSGRRRLRCVTHRHIENSDIDRAVGAFRAVADTIDR